jgi:hypothetical protein
MTSVVHGGARIPLDRSDGTVQRPGASYARMDIVTISRGLPPPRARVACSHYLESLFYLLPPSRWPHGLPGNCCDLPCHCSLSQNLSPPSIEAFLEWQQAGRHSLRPLVLTENAPPPLLPGRDPFWAAGAIEPGPHNSSVALFPRHPLSGRGVGDLEWPLNFLNPLPLWAHTWTTLKRWNMLRTWCWILRGQISLRMTALPDFPSWSLRKSSILRS